jgi:hypothetical protein
MPAQGIPEPDLVIYGVIQDIGGSAPVRVTVGTLVWTFQPGGGGPAIEVTGALANINDQFSYVLRVPCETGITGVGTSPGALRLGSSYQRAEVTVAGESASLVQVLQEQLTLGATDRGRIERIDLMVSLDPTGLLPDAWQLQYFGSTGVDPLADPDGDGVNNLDEYRAGTHPLDPESLFEVKVAEDVTGGPRLEWPSAAGRRYVIQRSQDIEEGFEVLVGRHVRLLRRRGGSGMGSPTARSGDHGRFGHRRHSPDPQGQGRKDW